MDCLVLFGSARQGPGVVSDIVADSPVGGGQSGRIELAAVIEVSDKGARTDGTGAQVSATVADVLVSDTPFSGQCRTPCLVRRPCRTSAKH